MVLFFKNSIQYIFFNHVPFFPQLLLDPPPNPKFNLCYSYSHKCGANHSNIINPPGVTLLKHSSSIFHPQKPPTVNRCSGRRGNLWARQHFFHRVRTEQWIWTQVRTSPSPTALDCAPMWPYCPVSPATMDCNLQRWAQEDLSPWVSFVRRFDHSNGRWSRDVLLSR